MGPMQMRVKQTQNLPEMSRE